MRNNIKTLIILSISFCGIMKLKAQEKNSGYLKAKQTAADSLFHEFSNTIYYTYYTPGYMPIKTPTFTLLKIYIDKKGKVANIQFSDSADSTFVKAYLNRKKWHDDKGTLEKYAREKSYTDVSLLIPISWEPQYANTREGLSYAAIKRLTKFNNKDFDGVAILFSPIYIKLSTTGNM